MHCKGAVERRFGGVSPAIAITRLRHSPSCSCSKAWASLAHFPNSQNRVPQRTAQYLLFLIIRRSVINKCPGPLGSLVPSSDATEDRQVHPQHDIASNPGFPPISPHLGSLECGVVHFLPPPPVSRNRSCDGEFSRNFCICGGWEMMHVGVVGRKEKQVVGGCW